MKNVKKPVLITLLIISLIVTQLDIVFFSRFAIGIVFLLGFELGRMEGLVQAKDSARQSKPRSSR